MNPTSSTTEEAAAEELEEEGDDDEQAVAAAAASAADACLGKFRRGEGEGEGALISIAGPIKGTKSFQKMPGSSCRKLLMKLDENSTLQKHFARLQI